MTEKLVYCVKCGDPLPIQQNGRPQRCCKNCKSFYRKNQKHLQYLRKVKFPTLDDVEFDMKLKELEKVSKLKRDRRMIDRELDFLKRHMKSRGLKPERLLGHTVDNSYYSHLLLD